MPVRETGVVYYFPFTDTHKRHLIDINREIGKTWVSTAMVDGKMRMKFAWLNHVKEVRSVEHDWNSPVPYLPEIDR